MDGEGLNYATIDETDIRATIDQCMVQVSVDEEQKAGAKHRKI